MPIALAKVVPVGCDSEWFSESEMGASPMPSTADLSRRYIEAHNSQDLDGLIDLVAADIDFKRPEDPVLTSPAKVRAQYAHDWSTHSQVHVGPATDGVRLDRGCRDRGRRWSAVARVVPRNGDP